MGVQQILDEAVESLAPSASFSTNGDWTVTAQGTMVTASGDYTCSKPLDVSTIPHQKTQSLSVEVLQAQDDGRGQVAHATDALYFSNQEGSGRNIVCDGVEHSFNIAAKAQSIPFLTGGASAFMTMTVCDLIGCISATSAVDFTITGDRYMTGKVPTPTYPILYTDAGFSGANMGTNVRRIDLNDITIGNDQISSLTVPPGWRVTLYEDAGFSGSSRTYTADEPYVGDSFNDLTSSVDVERI